MSCHSLAGAPASVWLQEDVEKSIPKKEETIIDVELTMLQKQYYRAIFERNREFLCRSVGNDGKARGPKLLNLESQLRKCCNHPYLLEGVCCPSRSPAASPLRRHPQRACACSQMWRTARPCTQRIPSNC